MSEKTTRYGKYLGKKAGEPHHLHPKDWGDKRSFKGSELTVYTFRDPDTGFIYHIHAPNEETAKAQADSRGWLQYRKKGNGKGKKSKRK